LKETKALLSNKPSQPFLDLKARRKQRKIKAALSSFFNHASMVLFFYDLKKTFAPSHVFFESKRK